MMSTPASYVEPIALEGRFVSLEPAGPEHIDALWEAGQYPELWRYRAHPVRSRDEMAELIERVTRLQCEGQWLMFATRWLITGEIVGSTSFSNVDEHNRRLEIGSTWITPAYQRTVVNAEAKYLQLRHCFETLGAARVEFKTDARNAASRLALMRIGAVEEGTMRRHILLTDGTWRDSVYYAIVETEWPRVRRRLEARLGGAAAAVIELRSRRSRRTAGA